MTTFTGYMVHVDFDGTTLNIVGHNKMSKIALAGQSWDQPLILERNQVADVKVKQPNAFMFMLVNGRIDLFTTDGRRIQLHFRRKQRTDLQGLAAALTQDSPAPAGFYPDPSNPAVQRYWDGATWVSDFDQN